MAVILLNYRGADDTLACLLSLQSLDYPAFQVIVVDNHSEDDSVERIQAAYPTVRLIESSENRGFSGGNNLGIRAALEDPDVSFVWLLNNDTTVEPQTLRALVEEAKRFPKALIGSVVRYPDGRFQRVGNRLDRGRGNLKSYSEDEWPQLEGVEALTGCSMLIPRAVFDEVGLWDERYFLYFEDNDFCLRSAQAGYMCRVAAGSRVFHREGATTGRNKPLVTYYYQRNRLILAKTFFSGLAWQRVQLYTLFRLFRSTIKSLGRKSPEAQLHHRAFRLAVKDFYAGVTGKCPHII